MALSLERQRFLLELGGVLLRDSEGLSMDSEGVVSGPGGKWTPREALPDLSELFAALRMVGLDPERFKFQVYDIVAANPFHGGAVNLRFPAQLVIKSDRYEGQHQLDLVLKSPFVAATEIKSYGRW
jgi:hypothetical protein